MKDWKLFGDECPICGNEAEVYTSAPTGFSHDGDNAVCLGCGHEGSVVCDGDEDEDGNTTAHVSWDDFED